MGPGKDKILALEKKMTALGIRKDDIEVKLAIKLGSEAGAVLVNVSGEAQMQVTLKWNLKQEG